MSLKLFVWKDKDRINHYGFAMALAETEEEARAMLIEKAEKANNTECIKDKIEAKPMIFEQPEAYYFYGSW